MHLKFVNFRDGVATSLIDGLTSMLAGFALFSVLGFMAHELGVSVDNVAASGKCYDAIGTTNTVSEIAYHYFIIDI